MKAKALFLLLISGLAGVLYGLASGNILAVAMPYFEATMNIGAARMGTLVASSSIVATVFGFAAGPLAEMFGRKRMLVLSALLFVLSAPVIVWCNGSYALLVTGFAFQGVSMGLVGTVAPLYLAESLPPEHRGKGTGLFQLFLIGGIVLSGVVGLAVAYWFGAGDAVDVSVAAKTSAWQALIWIAVVPAVLLFLGGLFAAESPDWKKGGTKDAAAESAGYSVLSSLKMLVDRRFVIPFVIVFIIVSCNKLCGLPFVLCYSVKIFQSCGLDGTYANWTDTVFKSVMFGGTALACVLVDRAGRKVLLGVGTLGACLSMLLIGGSFFAIEHGLLAKGGATGMMVAIGVVAFIGFYSVGPGVCVWLVMTEVLPTKIRAIGMSVILLANHFISSCQQLSFLPLGERFGYAPVFFFCAVCALVYFFAVRFGMPETKGMQLGEIEKWYDEKLKRTRKD